MKKIILCSFIASLAFVSCKKNDANSSDNGEVVVVEEVVSDSLVTVDGSNSENSLDWAGTYEATLPCADCPGIKTVIVLNPDNTFTISNDYLDRPTDRLNDQGTFTWYNNGSCIEIKGNASSGKYKVIENGLLQLDANGNEITGATKELYLFKKQS